MHKCHKCQHDNPDRQTICDECGATLVTEAMSTAAPSNPTLATANPITAPPLKAILSAAGRPYARAASAWFANLVA